MHIIKKNFHELGPVYDMICCVQEFHQKYDNIHNNDKNDALRSSKDKELNA